MLEKRHFIGVYGVFVKDGKMLMIKKSRGPYKGSYDLPGGQIESGETVEQALEREFMEETGCVVTESSYLGENFYESEYTNDKGETKSFDHKGTYFVVSLEYKEIKKEADGLDSLGAEFVDLKDLEFVKISPMARPMILKALA